MEKSGKQLFIFPEESGGSNQQNMISEKELSYPEKIRKELLYKDLQMLQNKFGSINNQALLEGGYFRRSSTFIKQEIDWINEFVGKQIVKVSKLDEMRMTWVPRQQENNLDSAEAA